MCVCVCRWVFSFSLSVCRCMAVTLRNWVFMLKKRPPVFERTVVSDAPSLIAARRSNSSNMRRDDVSSVEVSESSLCHISTALQQIWLLITHRLFAHFTVLFYNHSVRSVTIATNTLNRIFGVEVFRCDYWSETSRWLMQCKLVYQSVFLQHDIAAS